MELTGLLVGSAFGLAIGATLAWALLRGKAQAAEARYQEYRRNQEEANLRQQESAQARLDEYRRAQEERDRRLQETFSALASQALGSSSEAFLRLANQTLEKHLTQAQSDLELRKQAVDALVKPLADELKRMEQERQTAYGGLKQVTESLVKGQESLAAETRTLSQALRSPQIGGRWGELTLRRVVELASMVAYCDFEEQKNLPGELRDKRPDMVINLPNARRIAVDAKAPLDAYLQSVDAKAQETRGAALKNHARLVRERARELGSKAYWQALGYSPEFVVLFLPGEPFLSAALQESPQLLEEALSDKVILATPATLIALLLAVAYGWRERQAEENAQRISALGREMYERIATWAGHLDRVGDSLEKAVKAYNESVGSLEGRVLVSARRFKELGAGTERELPEAAQVDVGVRKMMGNGNLDSQGESGRSPL